MVKWRVTFYMHIYLKNNFRPAYQKQRAWGTDYQMLIPEGRFSELL